MLTRLLLLALLGFGAAATVNAQSSVWKVTKGAHSFYLGGTLHLLRQSDFPLPAEFSTAFDASARIYFETDISRIQSPEMHIVVAERGMYLDDQSLDRTLSPRAWKAAQTYAQKAGLPIEQIKRFRPWLFAITVATIELQKLGVSNEGVDMHFFKRAREAGKPTGELESFESQIKFITELGAGHESEMIEQTVEDLSEMPAKINQLLSAWRAGDVGQIDEYMIAELREKYPAIFKALLVDRNNQWMAKLDGLLKTPEVELVLVGAGHLAGKEGLLAQLRARGCKIEQIKASPTAPKKAK